MIPNRAKNNEIFGNDLKDRVTSCRKRLRINRSGHRVHLVDAPVAFVGKPTVFLDEYPAVRESYVGTRAARDLDDRKALETVEQEVGIT